MSPSLLVAVVPDMNTKSPTLTAREYPNYGFPTCP